MLVSKWTSRPIDGRSLFVSVDCVTVTDATGSILLYFESSSRIKETIYFFTTVYRKSKVTRIKPVALYLIEIHEILDENTVQTTGCRGTRRLKYVVRFCAWMVPEAKPLVESLMDLGFVSGCRSGDPSRLLDLATNGESGLRHYSQAPGDSTIK
jgi:hypothetical protein